MDAYHGAACLPHAILVTCFLPLYTGNCLFSHALKLICFPLGFFPQGKLTKLNHDHRDLKEKLKEERRQIEELWKTKTELEDERTLQDRNMEQLQRKVRGGPGMFIGPYDNIIIILEPTHT